MTLKRILVSSVSPIALGWSVAVPAAASPAACAGIISGPATGPLAWSTGNCFITGTATSTASVVSASGTLGTLTNTGSIGGGGGATGYGITQSGGSIAEIYNDDGRISGNQGISAQGGIGTLLNAGAIGGVAYAIDNAGTIATFANATTGTITGVTIGIYNTGTITAVNNGGTIGGGGGQGIANTGAISLLTNTAAGVISGYSGVLNLGRIGTLANTGAITGNNNVGFDNNGSLGGLGNGGLINGHFIGVLQESGSVTAMVNLGTITGGATGLTNAAAIGTISNSGTISGGANGIQNGDFAVSGTIFSLENDGLITGAGAGIYNNNSTIEALDNQPSGTISDIDNDVGALVGTLTNAGTIGGGAGLGVNNRYSSTILSLINDGEISALANPAGGVIRTFTNAAGAVLGALTNSGVMGGGAGPAILNDGSIGELTNTGTITGGATGIDAGPRNITLTNTGQIRGAAGPGLSFGAGQVTNAATGLITGVTGVSITGDGANLVNSGTIIGTGGTAIAIAPGVDPPQIMLTSASTLTGAITGGGGNGQIMLSGESTIASPITGFGPGSGLTIAAGASWTATGGWTLGTVTNAGAFQAGTPGTPLGLTGNFVQLPGATLRVAVTPTQTSHFIITGSATIAGGVAYIFAPGTYTAKTFPFLVAGDGVSGGFTAVSYAGYVPPALAHDTQLVPISVNLDLSPSSISVITTPGLVAPQDDGLFASQSQAQAQLAQTSGLTLLDIAASAPPATACAAPPPAPAVTFGQRDSAAQLAAAAGAAFCAAGGWSEAQGDLSSVDTESGSPGYHTATGGFLAGIEHRFGPDDTRLGLAAGYDGTAFKDGAGGGGQIGTARVSLYAAQPVGRAVLAGALGYGYAQSTTSRQTGLGALTAASFTNIISLGAAISTSFSRAGFDWQPRAGVVVTRLTGAHTAETARGLASAFAVHGGIAGMTSILPFITMSVAHTVTTASGLTITPAAAVGYQLDAGRSRAAANIFAADGTGFATQNHLNASAWTLDASVSVSRGGWGVFGRYHATAGGKWVSQTLDAGLLVRF